MTDNLRTIRVEQTNLDDVYGSDLHAISYWLKTKQLGSGHSVRAYKAAAFSLRNWLEAKYQNSTPDMMIRMSSIDATDFVGSLFHGGKNKTSTIKHKVVLLTSLYDFWMEPKDGGVQIVKSNPFAGIAKNLKSERTSNIGSQRALTASEAEQVRFTIEQMAAGAHGKHVRRTRLIWLLASRMALRREEIANLRANDFSMSSSKRRWILKIFGKGRAHADTPDLVVVPDDVLVSIQEYRKELGLHPEPLPSDAKPLLRRLAHESSSLKNEFMTPEHVARIMKSVFRMAAKDAANRLQDYGMEQRLLQSSIHWGRHTWFVNALQKHPIHLVSLGGRHKDIRTTQKAYVSLSEDDLAKLAE